ALGHTPHELLGCNVADYLHPDDIAAAAALWHRLLISKVPSASLHVRCRQKTGSWLYLEVLCVPLWDGTEFGGLICTSRVPTTPNPAIDAPKHSLDHFLALFERAPALIWRSRPNGSLDYANRTWLAF